MNKKLERLLQLLAEEDDEGDKKATLTVVTPDRVFYSAERKVSANYCSKSAHFGYETNVRPGENLETTTQRAINYVEKALSDRIAALNGNGTTNGTNPNDKMPGVSAT